MFRVAWARENSVVCVMLLSVVFDTVMPSIVITEIFLI